MKKIKYEDIAMLLYTIAIFAFMGSLFIGTILYNLEFVFLATICAKIAIGAFVYLLTAGILIVFISWELDDYMEKKETKEHGA